MKQILGILITLVVLYIFTAVIGDNFLSAYNQEQLLKRTALYGLLAIGVSFVIITGGIDLRSDRWCASWAAGCLG